MFHSVSLFSQAPLARESCALPSVLLSFRSKNISGVDILEMGVDILEMTWKDGIVVLCPYYGHLPGL